MWASQRVRRTLFRLSDFTYKHNHPLFTILVNLLSRANLCYKPWWFPFKNASTTVSRKRIYLTRQFDRYPFFHQEAHLLHEAVHLSQYKTMGRIRFLKSYATKRGRLRLETQANKGNLYYYLAKGVRNGYLLEAKVVNGRVELGYWLRSYISNIIQSLGHNYMLGDWFNDERKRQTKDKLNEYVQKWLVS